MNLFSNFTYFLENPEQGDQFEQSESRWMAGANLSREWRYDLANLPSKTTLGFQTRHDLIEDIGLYKTSQRDRLATVREDDVYQASYSLFIDQEVKLNDWLRLAQGCAEICSHPMYRATMLAIPALIGMAS
jgi:outer membrane receptor for ferrienterochelin and colicin